MVERDLSPARLQAFSDGVIAVIITLMVLELHVPADFTPRGLLAVWPTFAIYALSYLLTAIYWINHHHLFSMVKRVDVALLWTNTVLLFFLSLVPFLTAYVGQSRASSFPVFCYAVDMLISGGSFMLLAAVVARSHFRGDPEAEALHRSTARKNLVALTIYGMAIASAFWRPGFSLALIGLVAVMYFVPESWMAVRTEASEASGTANRV